MVSSRRAGESPRVIVALDFPDAERALALAAGLSPRDCRVKVGKELFCRGGPDVVRRLVEQGFDVFLDLKFHDIPNTVAAACRAAAELGVWMVNVHAWGGSEMLRAARDALSDFHMPPLLIGVTVLTSQDQSVLDELGVTTPLQDQVLRLAGLVAKAGLDGVVCSAREAGLLRREFGRDFALVTPGIRPAGSAGDDQKRIMGPAEAIRAGSSYLVVGRPITQSPDPAEALAGINRGLTAVETR